jgi:hypothetical protein
MAGVGARARRCRVSRKRRLGLWIRELKIYRRGAGLGIAFQESDYRTMSTFFLCRSDHECQLESYRRLAIWRRPLALDQVCVDVQGAGAADSAPASCSCFAAQVADVNLAVRRAPTRARRHRYHGHRARGDAYVQGRTRAEIDSECIHLTGTLVHVHVIYVTNTNVH